MGDDYTILSVEMKDQWNSTYGMMQNYDIHVQKAGSSEPEAGWVQLSQKPETEPPRVGGTLHGHIETKNVNGKSFKKFRKINPKFGGTEAHRGGLGGSQAPSGEALTATLSRIEGKLDYSIQMLEELTDRRDVVHDVSDENVNLDDPFNGLGV